MLLAAYLALAGYFFYALLLAFNQTLQIYSMMRNPEMLSRFNLNQMVIAPLLHNLAVLLIFIVGVVLTVVRAVTNSVAASFLVHVGYNGTLMLLAATATGGFRHMEKLGTLQFYLR